MVTDNSAESALVFRPVARRLKVSGKVQGVGFRWHMVQQASRLGLSGWVRNCQDGSVEACVAGAHDRVAVLIFWAGQGPASAQVASVLVEDLGGTLAQDLLRDFPGFTQQPNVR